MNTRTAQTLAGVIALGVSLTALTGCPWPCDPSSLLANNYAWDFEDASCTSALCGFEVVRGTAERAPSFHPGEHGMKLAPNSTVRQVITNSQPNGARLSLGATVSCDTNTQVTARVTSSLQNPNDLSRPPVIDVQIQTAEARNVWDRLILLSTEAPTISAERSNAVITIEISTGNSSCTLDSIDFSNGFGFCR